MQSFYEYIAQGRRMALPDTHTMLAKAGVPLGFPDEEETQRLLNRDRKRPIGPLTGGPRKANHPSLNRGLKAPVA